MNQLKRVGLPTSIALLAILLALAPAEKRLGQLIKAVYLHGAVTWVSFIVFAVFGVAALLYLVSGKEYLFLLAERGQRVGTGLWVVNFFIWVPLSYKTWNTIFGEPRAKAAVWVMLLLGLGFVLSQLLNSKKVLSSMYAVLGLGILVGTSGVGRVLHPFDPIGSSESTTIKMFFAAILVVCILIATQLILPSWKRYGSKI